MKSETGPKYSKVLRWKKTEQKTLDKAVKENEQKNDQD